MACCATSLCHPDRAALDQTLLQLTQELKVHPDQVAVAVNLLDCGATVPFVARYRKEATPSVKRCLTRGERPRR
jgi:transcriptional accessory protein Tex/SPT6